MGEVPEWRAAAISEIEALKPKYVERHGWEPRIVESQEAVDLFVRLQGARLPEQAFLLRVRYLPDWRVAGRREAFVDPDDPEITGAAFWPQNGSGINPNYVHNGVPTPAICLRGFWGYHSVLHTDKPMEGGDLLRSLVELQTILDHGG